MKRTQPFTHDFRPAEVRNSQGYIFLVKRIKRQPYLLTIDTEVSPALPELPPLSPLLSGSKIYLTGHLNGLPCYTAEAKEEGPPPEGYTFSSVRSLLGTLPEEVMPPLFRSLGIVDFDNSYLFCPHCGGPLSMSGTELAKGCSRCGNLIYPVISPAIIVLVRRGSKILLAHNAQFPGNLYSCIAGFVDPGETFENAVSRELFEETGIVIQNISYFGSQPWPFPRSLMAGFTAEYSEGEISVDGTEITDALWFGKEDLPVLPLKGSLSRKLIDTFLLSVPEGL